MSTKVVIITGAAGGIGSAISKKYLDSGWRVARLDHDSGLLQKTAEKWAFGEEVLLNISCDVTSEAECKSAIAEIVERWLRIDILINNAGITHRSAFQQTEIAVFRRVMEVNYFGSLQMTKFALPVLQKSCGMIVTISSISGFSPLYGRTGYSGSKYALHGLFESLRTEIQDSGVAVMMVCPGFTETGIDRNALDGDGSRNKHPRSTTGKIFLPQEVAERIYRGALKRKRLLVLSPIGKLAYWVSRLAPAFYEKMMVRNLSQELQRD